MAKNKKIADNLYKISDEVTGEPLAISRKLGSGKNAEFQTKLHPHVHSMYPEASHILSKINKSNSIEGAASRAEQMVDKLASGHKHEFDIVRDPEMVEHKGEYDSEPQKYHQYHIQDRETGDKILTLRHKAKSSPTSDSSIGTGDRYDQFAVRDARGASKENLDIAIKSANTSSSGIKSWVKVAKHLKKIKESGGPRFIGQQLNTSTGNKKIYKTSIQDPKEAIDAYIDSGAIPGHEKLERSIITPSMQLLHSDEDHHMIKFKDGEIHHTSSNTSKYNKAALNHVIEQTEN